MKAGGISVLCMGAELSLCSTTKSRTYTLTPIKALGSPHASKIVKNGMAATSRPSFALCWRPAAFVTRAISVEGYKRNDVYPENRALLGYYAASSTNFLPTFRDNLSVPNSGFPTNWIPKDGIDRLYRNVCKKLPLLAA
jgi:hypothetical protein